MRLTVDHIATPNRYPRLGAVSIILICCHSIIIGAARAQPPSPSTAQRPAQSSGTTSVRSSNASSTHPYRTPQAIALASRLKSRYQGSGDTIPILDWLLEISLRYEVSIWLDRSIASDQEVAISPRDDGTLFAAINEVAEQLHAGLAIYDHVIAIVPKENSACIEVAYWKLLQSSSMPLVWRADTTDFGWDDGARFSQVWDSYCKKYPRLFADPNRSREEGFSPNDRPSPGDFQLDTGQDQADSVEDIWRAARFQNTSPAAIAVTLLCGFNRVLQPVAGDSEAFQIAPLRMGTASSDVDWDYRDEIEKVGRERWKEWRERWPGAEVSRRDESTPTTWRITAPPRAHWDLVAYLAPKWEPKKPKSTDRSLKRYTGTYRGEFQRILEGIAMQFSLRLSLPKLPPQLARKEIDIRFEQASTDDIIAKLSEASGIRIRRKDDELVVEFP